LTRRDPHLENAKFNSIKIYKTLNVLLHLQLRAAGEVKPLPAPKKKEKA